MILQEILQKYAHDVSIIGHNVNGIPSEMQETRQSLQGTPHFTSPVALFFPERPIALPLAHTFHNSSPNPSLNSVQNTICL